MHAPLPWEDYAVRCPAAAAFCPGLPLHLPAQGSAVWEGVGQRHGSQRGADFLYSFRGREVGGGQHQFGGLPWLVGRLNAYELGQCAGAHLAVQTLGVASLRNGKRHVDEHFRKVTRSKQRAGAPRSAWKGEMNATTTITPASTKRRATCAMRWIFSARSASEKPRSGFRPCRMLSPSGM